MTLSEFLNQVDSKIGALGSASKSLCWKLQKLQVGAPPPSEARTGTEGAMLPTKPLPGTWMTMLLGCTSNSSSNCRTSSLRKVAQNRKSIQSCVQSRNFSYQETSGLLITWLNSSSPEFATGTPKSNKHNKVWNDLLPLDAKVLKMISSSDSMSKFARLKLLRLQRVAETAGNSRKWTKLNEDYPYQDELLIPSVFSPCADNTVVAGLVSRLFEGGDSKLLVFLQRVLVAPWMNSGTSCRVGMS